MADSQAVCRNASAKLPALADSFHVAWEAAPDSQPLKVEASEWYRYQLRHPRCGSRIDSQYVAVQDRPTPELPVDTLVCDREQLTLRLPESYEAYSWSDGTEGRQQVVEASGRYEVTVSDGDCRGSKATQVKLVSSPEANITVIGERLCPEEEVYLKLRADSAAHYRWSTGATNRSITVRQPDTFALEVFSEPRCRDTAYRAVAKQCEQALYVPDAFSPNGDGWNEMFRPKGDAVQDYQLLIYNRWGEEVFRSDNIEEGWNGQVKGQPAPGGNYLYLIRYRLANNEVQMLRSKEGMVQLLR